MNRSREFTAALALCGETVRNTEPIPLPFAPSVVAVIDDDDDRAKQTMAEAGRLTRLRVVRVGSTIGEVADLLTRAKVKTAIFGCGSYRPMIGKILTESGAVVRLCNDSAPAAW